MSKGRIKGLLQGRRRRNHYDRRRRYTGKFNSAAAQTDYGDLQNRGAARAATLLARWRAGDE